MPKYSVVTRCVIPFDETIIVEAESQEAAEAKGLARARKYIIETIPGYKREWSIDVGSAEYANVDCQEADPEEEIT